MQQLIDCLASVAALEQRITTLEQGQATHIKWLSAMQLHIEELEDQSRPNNLRLRGLPEATGSENLHDNNWDLDLLTQLDLET